MHKTAILFTAETRSSLARLDLDQTFALQYNSEASHKLDIDI